MSKTRTEIDKEMMYRKIMPTSGRKNDVSQSRTEEQTAFSGVPALPASAAMAKAILRPTVTMPIRQEQEAVLVNLMEELVLAKLDLTVDRFNCCKCDKCKKDIAALALNRLPPRYVVMKEQDRERRKQNEEAYSTEVTGALVQAILVVKKQPRH